MDTKINQSFSLDGRVVIITGGTGNLGRQYVASLTQAGAKVVIWDKAGVGESVDITDEKMVQEAVAKVVAQYGRIDALINNAAMNPVPGTQESVKQ
ncbi:MAG: SDR family NAD(P)-dependent oxidoreductase, partial [Patescibacteria group bacterium]